MCFNGIVTVVAHQFIHLNLSFLISQKYVNEECGPEGATSSSSSSLAPTTTAFDATDGAFIASPPPEISAGNGDDYIAR